MASLGKAFDTLFMGENYIQTQRSAIWGVWDIFLDFYVVNVAGIPLDDEKVWAIPQWSTPSSFGHDI